jgi:hypothetical protein
MSIPSSFALFDTKNHPFTIHIGDLKMGNLADTQSGTARQNAWS